MRIRIGAILSLMFLLLRCGPSTVSGVTDTGNVRVTAVIYAQDGSFASGAQVYLRSADYIEPLNSQPEGSNYVRRVTVTDDSGKFHFDSLEPGKYFIEVNDNETSASLLIVSFNESEDTTTVLCDTLQPYAAVKGSADITDAVLPLYVQAIGLERTVLVDTSGVFEFKDLPQGSFDFRLVSSDPQLSPIIVSDVAVESGEVTTLPFASWNFSKRLVLNTGPTGADIPGLVTGFPVLVRLNSTNFDFSSAAPDGSDLRFTKKNGTPLPYAVERFDAAIEKAEIWVRVDTVYGNNSTQYITMYWGNPNAADSSNSSKVFSASDSLVAVWHLDKDVKDATGAGNDAVESSARDTTGLIGNCKQFSGSDSIMVSGLLGTPSNLTLSAWAQLDSVLRQGSEILSLGDAAMIRMDFGDSIGTDGIIHQSDNLVFHNISSGRFLVGTGWHLITFTVEKDASVLTLYIDGEITSSRTDLDATINYTGVGQNTYIGKQGNGKNWFNFKGRIDEARVYNAPMSPDYIKLCYMNQKADDALIVFK